ncbi:MAG: hypothetical protein LUF02_01730 [Erysipelotrichaceae bacterium]|nr:hypothetical protein [Erysipelotrichaceae bacterium]
MKILGLVIALIALIVLIFKKVPTVITVIIASLIAGFINLLEPWTILNTLAEGTGSTFASYFFVFLFATMYGQLMSYTGCANAIADTLVKIFGKKNVVLVIIVTTGLLVYGGVTAMVVCFTVCPIGISLLREANVSKKFLPALIAFGQGTFALTALPGTPQLNNIIPTEVLKTSSTAAPVLGIIGAIIMFVLGTGYLQYEVNKSKKKGEGFDSKSLDDMDINESHEKLSTILGFTPIVLLIVSNILFENVTIMGYTFSEHGTYAAVSTAMFIAICYLIVLGLFKVDKESTLTAIKKGSTDWITPLLNFSMIVGFGSVIKSTDGFAQLVQIAINIPGPAYVSAAISTCLLAGVTGSASGGMKIALSSETLVNSWLSSGISTSALHRIISVASCGLDSLPHCGGILATLNVCKELHASSYKYIFVTTVLVPIVATVIIVGLACLGLTF